MKKTTLQSIFTVFSMLLSISLYAQPAITSFSPTSGVAGTTVTISGSNFSATIANNEVTFNGTAASVSAATETVLTIVVPASATTGAVQVQVGNQTATSSSVFTVLEITTCNGLSVNNAKNWYFGNGAAMAFESDGPVALTDSAMFQVEGVATISDANGNLLFYTNGITIYNKNHQPMLNGSGLLSHSSNTQAAFIVPFPGNPNQYFIITPGPYYYSIVDVTLDNGNGGVVPTAKNIFITSENSEKVAGLLTSNQTDIWLITYSSSDKRFNNYRITSNGLTTSPVISNFTVASGHYGYMKISPDETKIVTANFGNNFHLYDFDAATGIVSNQRVVNYPFGGFGTYGIEFSPNSNLVYAADHRGANTVYQFDITLETPELIAASAFALPANLQALGALQLGPDNKIYVAKENSPFLGVINNPNATGVDCDYALNGIDLAGKTSNLGLPGFVASAITRTEPYITTFTPDEANIGDTVTITGLNFNTTPSNNTVEINGIPAVVTTATSTELTVIVPLNASSGPISVSVGCGLVATTDDFTVTELGIRDFAAAAITLYPNPSTGLFHFTAENPFADRIEVRNIIGATLLSKSHFDLRETLDLSALSNGAYFISITQDNHALTKKVLKK